MLKTLNNEIENTLDEEPPYYYPDIRPSIRAASKLHNLLGFPEFSFQITMSYIEWSPGTARYLMYLTNLTDSELSKIHENNNMSIRYLALNGNSIKQTKKDIANLQDTMKTFVSFADALRRSDHIFCRI